MAGHADRVFSRSDEDRCDRAAIEPRRHGPQRECNLSFFSGEQALIKRDKTEAARMFQRAHEVCNVHTVPALAATLELKRLGN